MSKDPVAPSSNGFILEPICEAKMLSAEQAMNIYHLLCQVLLLEVPGEVVELGCNRGRTAVLLQRTLQQHGSDKQLHLYDSFQGLPEPTAEDGETPCRKGSMSCSVDEVFAIFNRFAANPPIVHSGWFSETLPQELPARIAFAHLDGDLYASMKLSLEHVYPRLSPGAVAVIDDYYDRDLHGRIETLLNESWKNKERGFRYALEDPLPGVKRACDEFFRDKPERVEVLVAGGDCHACFRKH